MFRHRSPDSRSTIVKPVAVSPTPPSGLQFWVAGRSAIVSRGRGILRRELQQNVVVRVPWPEWNEIRLRVHVRRIRVDVKLAVAALALLIELGMERDALHSTLMTAEFHLHAPLIGVHIQVLRDCLAVVADRI